MNWMIVSAAAAGGIVLLALAFFWFCGLAFDAKVARLRAEMAASQQMIFAGRSELPEIVRRYAVRAGGRIDGPTVFHADHEAKLSTAVGAEPLDIRAEQWTGTLAPGIVWAARGSMRGLPVVVLDAFVEGAGELSALLLGAIRVAGGRGPEYDKGELMRYLSELPVYPDAILNAAGLSWRQIDERTVEVAAPSAGGKAAMRFYFDAAGDIVRMEADDRPMSRPDGSAAPTPWHGIYGEYRQFGRYRIPSYGEVGWVLPEGLFTYWRGRVTGYEPAVALSRSALANALTPFDFVPPIDPRRFPK